MNLKGTAASLLLWLLLILALVLMSGAIHSLARRVGPDQKARRRNRRPQYH